jgi:hypothetical protein
MSFSNLVMDKVTGPIAINVGPQLRRPPQPGPPEPGQPAPPPVQNTTPPVDAERQQREPRPPGIVRNISFNGIHAMVVVPVQLEDVPFFSGYRPGEVKSCMSVNCVEGVLENITFNDVHVTFPGGGTAEEAANRDVPKVAGEYFETGVLPSYALFARNVRGLTLSNVRFEVAGAEARPAVVFDHVNDVAVNGFSVQGTKEAESSLRLIDSTDVLMSATRLVAPSAVFLQVEGAASQGIVIDGGDLSKAAKPVVFKADASQQSVKMRL